MINDHATPLNQILHGLAQNPYFAPNARVSQGTARPDPMGRQLIALAGPPASGKSTLAKDLCAALNRQGRTAKTVPMDGFHLDNETLTSRNLLHRKGAPNTFDVDGLIALIKRLKHEDPVNIPHFDRTTDAVIQNADQIRAGDEILVVEGNYLLINMPPWNQLAPLFDFKVFLQVPQARLKDRLVARWQAHGLDDTAAMARATENDLPNALTTLMQSHGWDLIVTND